MAETDSVTRTENDLNLSEDTIRRSTVQWHWSRDLMMGLTVMFYLITILDAHIAAHLKDFDVNQDLSFEVTPTVDQLAYIPGPVVGISIKLNF